MSYKHIVFDIDGTLVDTIRPIMLALQKTAEDLLNKTIPINELTPYFGIPGDETLKILGVAPEKVAGGMIIWHNHYYEVANMSKVFEGIESMLISLKESSYSLGIITSKTEPEYKDQFMKLGLAKYFDMHVFAGDTSHGKPSPEPMLKYIEKSQIAPKEILYIGDTIHDMSCARDAGVKCGLAMWGATEPNTAADYHFKTPLEITETVFNS